MNTVSHNRGRKLPPEPLSKSEVLTLMATCSQHSPIGLRDRALIAVLWRGQLRISEALALKPADFDADFCALWVLHGKGDRTRVAVVDRGTVDVLQSWMDARRELGVSERQPIFCTLKGGEIDPGQIREMLPRRARKAGITKRCNPHNFRHSGASELASAGVPILMIKEQLGHANIGTTDRYIHALNPKARIDLLKAREW